MLAVYVPAVAIEKTAHPSAAVVSVEVPPGPVSVTGCPAEGCPAAFTTGIATKPRELDSTPLGGVRIVFEVTAWTPSIRGQVTCTLTASVG